MRLSKIIDIKYHNAVQEYKKEAKAVGHKRTLTVSLLDLRVAWYELLMAIF